MIDNILIDSAGRVIPTFLPDPNKSLAPISGTYVFQKGTGGDTNITGWTVLMVRPITNSITYYFNSDTTKIKTIDADTDNLIPVGQKDITSITFTLGTTTAQVQGM